MYLNFLCAFRSAADIAVRHWNGVWEAVTAGLIHQIPGEDCGVIFVQPVVDGVAPVDHDVNVVLKELLHIWIGKEDVIALSTGPLNVLHVQETQSCVMPIEKDTKALIDRHL